METVNIHQAKTDQQDSLGLDRGRFIVPEDFNDPLPEEILAAFEGGEDMTLVSANAMYRQYSDISILWAAIS